MTDEEYLALRRSLIDARDPSSRRPGRRRRKSFVLGGAVVAVVLAVGTPAMAVSLFNAQTGVVVPPDDTENSAANELIDLAEEDFTEYAESVFPYQLPVPDGVDIDDVRVAETRRILEKMDGYEADPAVLVGDQVIIEEFALAVWCLWSDQLEYAAETGDADEEARARAVIIAAPQWEAIQEEGSTYNGMGLRGFFRIAARNAEAGATSVQRFVASYSGFSCSYHGDLESYRGADG